MGTGRNAVLEAKNGGCTRCTHSTHKWRGEGGHLHTRGAYHPPTPAAGAYTRRPVRGRRPPPQPLQGGYIFFVGTVGTVGTKGDFCVQDAPAGCTHKLDFPPPEWVQWVHPPAGKRRPPRVGARGVGQWPPRSSPVLSTFSPSNGQKGGKTGWDGHPPHRSLQPANFRGVL